MKQKQLEPSLSLAEIEGTEAPTHIALRSTKTATRERLAAEKEDTLQNTKTQLLQQNKLKRETGRATKPKSGDRSPTIEY